jgi:competence protein ComEA
VTSGFSRLLVPFAAAFVLAAGLSASAQNTSAQNTSGKADDHPSLPPGQGREVMIRVCSQCHEPEMAADQQFDEAEWKSLVDQMAGKGATATEAELDEIVRYLAKSFPAAK